MSYFDRPQFNEGQLLSATDLQLAVTYPRQQLEIHGFTAHVSGIVEGMNIQIAPPSAAVTPGLAIDTQGRQLFLDSPIPVGNDPLVGQPAGNYPVYAWYTEAPLTTALSPLNPCSSSGSDQIRETPMVGIILSPDVLAQQAPGAVCLGYVGWDGAAFANLQDGATANAGRQGGGVRAHTIVAPDHAIAVNAEDKAATTFSVAGTLEAIAPADGKTSPIITVPGGSVVFSNGDPSRAVSLSFNEPTATGNGLVIDLGNNDSSSSVVVESAAGTALVTLDGSGNVTANQVTLQTLNAQNVSVAVGQGTLMIGPTPPSNNPGISASNTLLLACGTNAGDQVEFLSGASPIGTVDATGLTMNNVKVGQVDSSTVGIAITNTQDLHLNTASGDVFVNPGSQASAPFRFTTGNRLLNQTVSPIADVTPLTQRSANGDVLQLGPLCVAFGTVLLRNVKPLSDGLRRIDFPVTFTSLPAFFVSAWSSDRYTIGAVAFVVETTYATYRINQLAPFRPQNNNSAKWADDVIDQVNISWIALGSVQVP